jgi:hypothetical protein
LKPHGGGWIATSLFSRLLNVQIKAKQGRANAVKGTAMDAMSELMAPEQAVLGWEVDSD